VLALAIGFFAFDKFVLDPARDIVREEAAEQRGRTDAFVESFGDNSIAVLPFVNMSADPDQVFFSDGISEEILNLLAKIRQLRVISRSSAFMYRDDVHVPTVAEELNVSFVLEGSVRKAGNKVRITAQLIDARTDTHLWSETWDRNLADIFAIQDEVAGIVAHQLELELLGQQLESRRTDPELYTIYLQAKHSNYADVPRSQIIKQLEYVLEQDPEFLPAVNLLGLTYYYATGIDPDDLYAPDAGYALYDGMISRALAIDPNDAVSNAYLAWDYLQVGRDVESSVRTAEKAFNAAPGNAEVLRSLCALARTLGKPETAIALGEMSVARDPRCLDCYYVLYRAYMNAGQYVEAEQVIRRLMAIEPHGWHGLLGASLLARGDAAAALEAYDQLQGHGTHWLTSRATALYTLDRTVEYKETLLQILNSGAENEPLAVAGMYAWAGDIDNAFPWLDKAIESGIRQVDVALWDFRFVSLRDDPRWHAFWDEHWFTEEEFAAVELDIP